VQKHGEVRGNVLHSAMVKRSAKWDTYEHKRLSKNWFISIHGEQEGTSKFLAWSSKGRSEADRVQARNRDKLRRSEYQKNKLYDPTRQKQMMVSRAKARAVSAGVPFNITVDAIVIPETCPMLGIPLFVNHGARGAAGPNSPSLDKSLG